MAHITIRNLGSKRRRKLRRAIYMRDFGRCRYCAKALAPTEITLDHVRPYSIGGRTSKKNLVAACKGCNVEKGVQWRKPLPRHTLAAMIPVMMDV